MKEEGYMLQEALFPAAMATQHPDNSREYVGIQQEPEEAFAILGDPEEGGLGIPEMMIDFEGKLTPYHQTGQIALGLIARGKIPGRDLHLTPRIPNARKEPVFRQLMSLMSLVETNVLAYGQSGIQAITETIVPMIEKGEEVIAVARRIASVMELGTRDEGLSLPPGRIRVIPLLESVPALIRAGEILSAYAGYLEEEDGSSPESLRIMLARSDSAMSYGMASSVLAIRLGLSGLRRFSEEKGISIGPILGCGSLPFRGGLREDSLKEVLDTYPGVRTFTIQSGLRYDHGPEAARAVAARLSREAWKTEAPLLSGEEEAFLKECIGLFTLAYIPLFSALLPSVEALAPYLPKNRDRLTGSRKELQYIREMAELGELAEMVRDPGLKEALLSLPQDFQASVPRAISFTASLYTLGLPPEFMGTGRGLEAVRQRFGLEGVEALLQHYPGLKGDLERALPYVNLSMGEGMASSQALSLYMEDLALSREILGLEEQPAPELYHLLLQSSRPILLHLTGRQGDILESREEEEKVLREWMMKMGTIRGSLG